MMTGLFLLSIKDDFSLIFLRLCFSGPEKQLFCAPTLLDKAIIGPDTLILAVLVVCLAYLLSILFYSKTAALKS